MIPTKLSHRIAGVILNAQIRLYPDAAYSFLFQYPTDVAADRRDCAERTALLFVLFVRSGQTTPEAVEHVCVLR